MRHFLSMVLSGLIPELPSSKSRVITADTHPCFATYWNPGLPAQQAAQLSAADHGRLSWIFVACLTSVRLSRTGCTGCTPTLLETLPAAQQANHRSAS